MNRQITFKPIECTCRHPAAVHADGFGCTNPDCDCLAGWELQGNLTDAWDGPGQQS